MKNNSRMLNALKSATVAVALAIVVVVGSTRESAAVPDLQLSLQPFQVCNNVGLNCANSAMQLFEAEGDKIWDQAGIDLVFLPWVTINDSSRLNETDFSDLTANANSQIVNIYFIESLSDCGGPANPNTLFGCGGGGRIAVTDLVFDFNGGNGRRDTIAHEIGHVLGLPHSSFGDDYLMTSGGSRDIPGGVGDINPDGLGLSKFDDTEVDTARASRRLAAIQVSEPAAWAIIGVGIAGIALRRRAKT